MFLSSLAFAGDIDSSLPTNLNQISGSALSLGQKTMANSIPMTISSDQAAYPVTCNAGTNLNTSALSTSANQSTLNTRVGDLTETAPATDTASSGLNGRLQRVAQNLTTLNNTLSASITDTLVTGNITAACSNANINSCGANSTVSIGAQGFYTTTANLTGTWVATVVFDGQMADGNWIQLPVVQIGTVVSQITQKNANGAVAITGGGYQNVRARASVYTSGTIGVGLESSLAQQTVIAVTVPNTWSYRHLAGASTTTIKTGGGVLHAVCQNNQAGTTTVYDNTAGSGTTIAALTNSGTPGCITFDLAFTTGLTVVMTAGGNDATITYQ